MSAAAVVKSTSKPFCSARYAMAMARCVLPRPGLPTRITERPSVTKSGESREPTDVSRSVDWKLKSNSSMVRRNGKCAARVAFVRRVPRRCAISSEKRTKSMCSYDHSSFSARSAIDRHARRACARWRRFNSGSRSVLTTHLASTCGRAARPSGTRRGRAVATLGRAGQSPRALGRSFGARVGRRRRTARSSRRPTRWPRASRRRRDARAGTPRITNRKQRDRVRTWAMRSAYSSGTRRSRR